MTSLAASSVSQLTRLRLTLTIFLSQSLFSAAFIAFFTLTPAVAADLSGRDALAGVPATLVLIGRALAAYPLGWIMDRSGRRPGLSLGYLLAATGALAAAFSIVSGSFVGLCLGSSLLGMGRGAGDQARYAAAEIFDPQRQAKVIGWIVFAGTIGAVGGPALVEPSGQVMAGLGLATRAGPYAAAGLLLLLALFLTFLSLRPDPGLLRSTVDTEPGPERSSPVARPLREIFAGRYVQLAVMALVIGQLVMSLIMVITPLHMAHHEHTDRVISWVIMAHTLGMFGLSTITGWLVDRIGRVPMITAGGLVLVVATILAPRSVQFSDLALALFLLGLGWNFSFVAGSSLLSDALSPAEKGRAQGAAEVMVALASGTGSFSTGLVFEQGGITTVSIIGLVLSLALLAAVAVSVWQREPVRAGQQV